MKLIYKTIITNVGNQAKELFEQDMFIIFKEDVPEYLSDYCFLHAENNLISEIENNDIVKIGDEVYKVTAVGSVVNENLLNLGHITFKFSGEFDATIPGTLYLEKKEIVPPVNGTKIEIVRV